MEVRVLLLLTLGCWIGTDDVIDRQDVDGDGYVAVAFGGDDCDDGDATVYWGAPRLCDGLDHDCDGHADVEDVDGDGSPGCEDCDDADPARSPALPERCDAADVDEDCDGLADDADDVGDPPLGRTLWYVDGDGDGLGGDGTGVERCDAVDGAVTVAGDCDDADPWVPAPRETCYDGADNDCDGDIDVCEVLDAYAEAELQVRLTTSMGLASDLLLGDDLTGDGRADLVVAQPQAIAGRTSGVYVYSEAGLHGVEDATATVFGSDASMIGNHIQTGDLTGDGAADLVLTHIGPPVALRLVPGPLAGLTNAYDAPALWEQMSGPLPTPCVGDVTGDGQSDLVLCTVDEAWVHEGPVAPDLLGAADAHITWSVELESEWTATIGDLTGDGVGKLVLGSPWIDEDRGAAQVLDGEDRSGEVDLQVTGQSLEARYTGSFAGAVLDAGEDVDGDGYDDLLVLGTDLDDPGEAWLVYGRTGGLPSDLDGADAEVFSTEAGVLIDGVLVPDVDGDGRAEVFLSSVEPPSADGRGWLLLHVPEGMSGLDGFNVDHLGPYGTAFSVTGSGSRGPVVDGGGDWDGDGVPDLALSAPWGEPDAWAAVVTGWRGGTPD